MEIEQLIYERVYSEMERLTTEDILKGCKTFEEYGMQKYASCDDCFVANILGSGVMTMGLRRTYVYHFYYPEIVWLVACDILEERGSYV